MPQPFGWKNTAKKSGGTFFPYVWRHGAQVAGRERLSEEQPEERRGHVSRSSTPARLREAEAAVTTFGIRVLSANCHHDTELRAIDR